jgi:hypothetical protein
MRVGAHGGRAAPIAHLIFFPNSGAK